MSEMMSGMTAENADNHVDQSINTLRYLSELGYFRNGEYFFENDDTISARAIANTGDEIKIDKSTHLAAIDALLNESKQGEYNLSLLAFYNNKKGIAPPSPQVEVRRGEYTHRFRSPKYAKRAADIILGRINFSLAEGGHDRAEYFVEQGRKAAAARSRYETEAWLLQPE